MDSFPFAIFENWILLTLFSPLARLFLVLQNSFSHLRVVLTLVKKLFEHTDKLPGKLNVVFSHIRIILIGSMLRRLIPS